MTAWVLLCAALNLCTESLNVLSCCMCAAGRKVYGRGALVAPVRPSSYFGEQILHGLTDIIPLQAGKAIRPIKVDDGPHATRTIGLDGFLQDAAGVNKCFSTARYANPVLMGLDHMLADTPLETVEGMLGDDAAP